MIIKPLFIQVDTEAEKNTGWLEGAVVYVVESGKYYELRSGTFYQITDAPFYRRRATMWHDGMTVITGTAKAKTYIASTNVINYVVQGPPANGDSFSNSFFLKAGTYSFYVLGYTNSNCGLIDWYVDGVKVISLQDWYSASLTYGVTQQVDSITITGDGYHKLVGTVNGKNGSSVSPYYYVGLLKYWFAPSSDPAR
jgi:hypothetical protein